MLLHSIVKPCLKLHRFVVSIYEWNIVNFYFSNDFLDPKLSALPSKAAADNSFYGHVFVVICPY